MADPTAALASQTCHANSTVRDDLLSSKASTVIGSLILSLALAVGLPGNAFVLWTILWRMRRRRLTVTCLLILNLAVADGVTLLTTPLWIQFLLLEDWAFGRASCKVLHYVCCLNMYASVFLIALMSVDRLLAVTRPHAATHLRRRPISLRVLAGLWALSALMAVPAPYYRDVQKGKIECQDVCEPIHPSLADTAFHYLLETVVGFLAPYAIIVASYVMVGRRLRRLRSRRKGRVERLIAAIVVAFGLFWLPYHVTNLAQVWAKAAGSDRLRGWLKEKRPMVTALAFVGSGVNPVLYAFTGVELIRTSGPNFLAKLFETTTADGSAGQSRIISPGSRGRRRPSPATPDPSPAGAEAAGEGEAGRREGGKAGDGGLIGGT